MTYYEYKFGHFQDDTRTRDELVADLGEEFCQVFQGTYHTRLNYHFYHVRFLKLIESTEICIKVSAVFYEDDIPISPEVSLGFWFGYGKIVCDMNCAFNEDWDRIHGDGNIPMIVNKIEEELKDSWNAAAVGLELKRPDRTLRSRHDWKIPSQRLRVVHQVQQRTLNRHNHYDPRDPSSKKIFYLVFYYLKKFTNFEFFLRNSGIVYLVTDRDVLIYNNDAYRYQKLAGYYQEGEKSVLELTD